MTPDILKQLQSQFEVLEIIDLDTWHSLPYEQAQSWLDDQLKRVWKSQYLDNQRLIFDLKQEVYVHGDDTGLCLKNLQLALNQRDISNFFVLVVSSNPNLDQELQAIAQVSTDPVPIRGVHTQDQWSTRTIAKHPASNREIYQYGSVNPLKISLNEMTDRHRFLLTDSKYFCMYPWIHLHAWPTGQAFPCCMSEASGQVGDTRTQTLQEIWNGQPMRDLRTNMLKEQPSQACVRCYEQENSGFFSGRRSANKHHGHLISRVDETESSGRLERFEMTYWDIRFSNLCNLRCRSCGHIFSSQWYRDQAALAGPEWARQHKVLNYAGRTETDMWEQLIPHLDHVEQIYFAGGEPLLMEEHYNILDELDRRGRHDVRLIYNTNFTEIRLKDRTVFDYWRRFESVAVGASLDASGARAEYIRKGTDWAQVERNRELMLEVCPDVDFYISPTLSIMNAWHLPDFHRDWVARGFIKPQDLNVNILQDPPWYRIDMAPKAYKQELAQRFQQHIDWLRPQDSLNRATTGFESALAFMSATDNTDLLPTFWAKTTQLDEIRKENILTVLPELEALR